MREEGTVTGSNPTSDGEWHLLGVEFSTNQVTLKIDENVITSNTTQSVTITDLIQNTDKIFIGGVSSNYYIENLSKFSSDTKFKGCMESVRLGGVLLPFYSPQDLGSNPTLEQFTVKTISETLCVTVTYVNLTLRVGTCRMTMCVSVWRGLTDVTVR